MAAVLPYRDINVHSSPSHYAFSSPSSPSAPTLVVDRPSGDIRLHDGKLLGSKRVSSVAGILGIIKLRLDKYIIVITKAQPMGRIKGHMIYKVITTEFLPLRERPLHDADEDSYLTLLKGLLKTSPLYFSYSFDITNSFQRQAHLDPAIPLWKRADDRFFWNRFIQTDLIDFRGGLSGGYGRHSSGQQPEVDPYILPVMFGMMEIKNTSIKGNPLTFILITRRSRLKAGTRYFSRGIDENGNVSNFNETEQTIILNDHASGVTGGFAGGQQNGSVGGNAGKEVQVLAYVQTRGSVPVYWAEINTLKYTPKLQIRGIESAVTPAKKHFAEQIRLYGDNWLVNLVNQKGREQRVKEAYEQMVKVLVSSPAENAQGDNVTSEKFHIIEPEQAQTSYDRIHYVYFDFHSETKGLRWDRAKLLLNQLEEPIRQHGYFRGVDMPGDTGRVEVRKHQTAVVRTNCMDCLDRTNVVQSMLGRFILSRMLIDLGLLREGENASDDEAFESLFRNVWADNADVVSRSYSGTGALKTDFTRTGNRTKAGALQDLNNSITRYFLNNFMDGPRQDAFDLFLGAYLPAGSGIGSQYLFADRRPIFIQSIPYIFAASVFLIFVGSFTRRGEDATVWPFRLLMFVCLGLAAACGHFIAANGTLYVNWPRLNRLPWAIESMQDALSHVQHNPVVGSLVGTKHERGKSDARVAYLEEGKKRIE
ncbi:phosphoinositide phosphatase-like protein [Aaosphaeria arxii CBS 175.79]|uniref:Phosphoinositide phosphatase-like protein n=1 Tax=Aaosphaeria arxii CBS 175.79 TaxID=1450172 RepID=A0A6A5Y731_9PLEO|nr:phosphoinositide phosphatase-like protein [Aaosphaeria arxii CBS 175.79]KAF2020364.1 phosphoinositide phosphatase-like protein [Aaosphaeria arxii CBS 175.79]